MSGEDAPRPYLENLIVPEIKTNKQTHRRETVAAVLNIVEEEVVAVMVVNCYSAAWQWVQVTCLK
jgi:hypothetical protein